MNDETGDPLLGLLQRLPVDAPSRASIERVLARSHAALATPKRQAGGDREGFRARIVSAALYAACFAYVAGALAEAAKVSGLLR